MDVSDLENAINSAKDSIGDVVESINTPVDAPADSDGNEAPKMSSEEELGFHKGALNTLAAERNELVKMIGNVEAIMQAHMSRLKELGADLK
ncbi:MAG: hypothetical protein OEL87_01145 [Nanoarchaeota archaeon]|nr:hypothetical protein [Nanoarchaeota archaeon]